MAIQHDPQSTTDADTASETAVAREPTDPAVVQVRALVARGASPAEVAAAIGPTPSAGVLAYLHQTRGNGFVQQVVGSSAPQQKHRPPKDAFVVHVDGQYVQVYVSPDGIDANPDVFMFFHGKNANLKIDPAMKDQPGDNMSGNDTAGAAMAKGKEKNTIALLPQGVRGGAGTDGGKMTAIVEHGLEKFLDDVLAAANQHIAVPGTLQPRHIALAGHSAGGPKGLHEALASTGKYADTISDITLMDSSYAEDHFVQTRDWMFTGSPNKTVRIIQSKERLKDDRYEKGKLEGAAYWARVFSDAALDAAVQAHPDMSIKHLQTFDFKNDKSYGRGQDRGNQTEMVQHTQVLTKDGKVQCDILVLHSKLGHHEIRDSTMDDAIHSIGEGAAGSDRFGRDR